FGDRIYEPRCDATFFLRAHLGTRGSEAADGVETESHGILKLMRGTRWLLLAAILAILVGTAYTYYAQRRLALAHAAPKPAAIGTGLSSSAEDWRWTRTDAGKLVVEISAKGISQVANSDHMKLETVTM